MKDDIISLADDEQYALNRYLGFESYLINEKLRSIEKIEELSEGEQLFISNLDSALRKIPKYKGFLSRSLYFGNKNELDMFLSKFAINEEVQFKEYISATCADELYNPAGEVQIFIEHSLKGRNITGYNANESEVLYERNSRFKVLSINHIKENLTYIELEEL